MSNPFDLLNLEILDFHYTIFLTLFVVIFLDRFLLPLTDLKLYFVWLPVNTRHENYLYDPFQRCGWRRRKRKNEEKC